MTKVELLKTVKAVQDKVKSGEIEPVSGETMALSFVFLLQALGGIQGVALDGNVITVDFSNLPALGGEDEDIDKFFENADVTLTVEVVPRVTKEAE